MNVTLLDVILGACAFAAIIGVVVVTMTGHDVAVIGSIATGLVAALVGKKVDPKA